MRYLAVLAIIILGCNDAPEQENQSMHEKEAPPFLSDSKSNLFFHLCSDLTICNRTAFVVSDTIENEDYRLTYQYQLETDTTVVFMRMMVYCGSQKVYETCTESIHGHLTQFSDNHSSSDNFETWILPLYGKPLIEVDVFTNDNKKQIRIELVKRPYI